MQINRMTYLTCLGLHTLAKTQWKKFVDYEQFIYHVMGIDEGELHGWLSDSFCDDSISFDEALEKEGITVSDDESEG